MSTKTKITVVANWFEVWSYMSPSSQPEITTLSDRAEALELGNAVKPYWIKEVFEYTTYEETKRSGKIERYTIRNKYYLKALSPP